MDLHSIMTRLSEPFPGEDVRWRCGAKSKDQTSALALAYMDARLAEERLDEVMGIGGWQCRYTELRSGARAGGQDSSPSIIICEIGLKLDGEWIWRANGAGDTDMEAEKGALSDAFKRAATKWGIGRYLYGFPSPWVKIVPQGKSWAIDKGERPKLAALAAKALADFKADPKNFRAPEEGDEPERPGFTPAPAPPARPEQKAPLPAPAPVPGPGTAPPDLGTVAGLRRALDVAGVAALGPAYVAAARALLGEPRPDVDAIVAVLKAHPPPPGHGLAKDVEQARRRVAQGAAS